MDQDESKPEGGDDERDILASLGRLSLAAADAERSLGAAMASLLTEETLPETLGGVLAATLRSMRSMVRILQLVLPDDVPIKGMLSKIEPWKSPADSPDSLYAATLRANPFYQAFEKSFPNASPRDLLNRISSLHEKRNRCMHAYELRIEDSEVHLVKSNEQGAQQITASDLIKPCILRDAPLRTMAGTIEWLATELKFAASCIVPLVCTVRAYRRWTCTATEA